jgi:hypothetical protein
VGVAWFTVASEDSGGLRQLPGMAVQRLKPRAMPVDFRPTSLVSSWLIIDRATNRCDFADHIRWNQA